MESDKMNNYTRHSQVLDLQTPENFAKNKQDWEYAIDHYQGPDPLDHWWNFICWYENCRHVDPDNKFRETLERCLTQYEHSDYYKGDIRMVRLWLKYIAMQNNPLHFYQVLHQRGVGTQLACFYISWANYYESVQAFKEVEAVYNLAFQEKAQPYSEIHNAHSKFLYAKSLATNSITQQQAAISLHAPHQYHQHHLQNEPRPEDYHQVHSHHQPHLHSQHVVSNNTDYRNPSCYQANEGMTGTLPTASVHPANNMHYQNAYNQHSCQENQQQSLEHSQYSFQNHHQQLSENYPNQQEYQVNQSIDSIHQQQNFINNSVPQDKMNGDMEKRYKTNEVNDAEKCKEEKQINEPHSQDVVEEFAKKEETLTLKDDCKRFAITEQHNKNASTSSDKDVPQNHSSTTEDLGLPSKEVKGICLPRRFATYSCNNKETWQPALFLEEPADPQRVCHYPKNIVYPPSTGMEYSPEEIKARRYKYHPQASLKQQMAEMINNNIQRSRISQIYQQHEQQAKPAKESTKQSINLEASTSMSDQPKDHDKECEINSDKYEAKNIKKRSIGSDCEDDKDNEGLNNKSGIQHNISSQPSSNEELKCENQIEASTIHFTSTDGLHNKTIKIKFKKDRSVDGCEASNAYKIERIYQPEFDKEIVPGAEKRNGAHTSFHPYFSTSTPKSTSKRQKSKVKRVHASKRESNSNNILTSASTVSCNNFPVNSNSSSLDNAQFAAIPPALKNNATPTSVQNIHFNDNANCAFSSAVNLDSSSCSLTNAVDRLNFRDMTPLNNINSRTTNRSLTSGRRTSLTNTDISLSFHENSLFTTQHDVDARDKRLDKAIETVERHMAKEAVDPFSSELCRAFLTKLNFPRVDDHTHAPYKIVQTPLPKIANTRQLNPCPGVQFNVDKEIGRGSYGSVFKATDSSNGKVMALKFQKPANTWEIYICDQVSKRIKSAEILPGLMTISTAIIAPNASLIATEFSPFGSLLDINNKLRQATTKVMHESLVMHFSAQICDIIFHLHKSQIIHADIKPDNFLLMRVPSTELQYPSLRLIDFGCAIDMTLFPQGSDTKFRKVIQTDGFTCIEMLEGRTWSYETDLFCIAGTVHVMLFGEYMQLQKRGNIWDIKQKLPRYLKKHIWSDFFSKLLNIKPGGKELPDLSAMCRTFQEESMKMESELQKHIRTLSNLLHRR